LRGLFVAVSDQTDFGGIGPGVEAGAIAEEEPEEDGDEDAYRGEEEDGGAPGKAEGGHEEGGEEGVGGGASHATGEGGDPALDGGADVGGKPGFGDFIEVGIAAGLSESEEESGEDHAGEISGECQSCQSGAPEEDHEGEDGAGSVPVSEHATRDLSEGVGGHEGGIEIAERGLVPAVFGGELGFDDAEGVAVEVEEEGDRAGESEDQPPRVGGRR